MTARLLHVFATFVPGGPQVRTARLIAGLGPRWRHEILAMDGRVEAAALLAPEAGALLLPSLSRRGTVASVWALRALLRARKPDLVLTYNWGAIEAVAAARLAGRLPLLHHEDGFLPDELAGFKRRRILARRVLLRSARGVLVPSQRLQAIATGLWRVPAARVRWIPNGIALAGFSAGARDLALRRELGIPADALVVGGVGHLRAEKNPVRLVEALAAMRAGAHLLLVGDGPERGAVEARCAARGLSGRVHLAGHRAAPAPCYAAMDVFALPSDTEQMPVALLEAMASGLPVAATDVGDVRVILPPAQAEFVVPLAGAATAGRLAAALDRLAAGADLRRHLGAENRARVAERYTEAAMLAAHRTCWEAALAEGG
ncbi:MAG: glycosyltransferase [Planctomycetota bacterium]